jgi:hypothetical protein
MKTRIEHPPKPIQATTGAEKNKVGKSQKKKLPKATFQDLPPELKESIFAKLNGTGVVAVSQTSKLNHGLVVDNAQVWRQHGVNPARNLPGTMQAAFVGQIRTLAPHVKNALPELETPLNVFSEGYVRQFSENVVAVNAKLASVQNSLLSKSHYSLMFRVLSTAADMAAEAGMTIPSFSAESKTVLMEAAKQVLELGQKYAVSGDKLAMDLHLDNIERYVKISGIEMPPLSAEMKAFCRVIVDSDMAIAAEKAARGEAEMMGYSLSSAAINAERAGVRMPSLSMDTMTQEVKVAYAAFIKALDPDVKPASAEEQDASSKNI